MGFVQLANEMWLTPFAAGQATNSGWPLSGGTSHVSYLDGEGPAKTFEFSCTAANPQSYGNNLGHLSGYLPPPSHPAFPTTHALHHPVSNFRTLDGYIASDASPNHQKSQVLGPVVQTLDPTQQANTGVQSSRRDGISVTSPPGGNGNSTKPITSALPIVAWTTINTTLSMLAMTMVLGLTTYLADTGSGVAPLFFDGNQINWDWQNLDELLSRLRDMLEFVAYVATPLYAGVSAYRVENPVLIDWALDKFRIKGITYKMRDGAVELLWRPVVDRGSLVNQIMTKHFGRLWAMPARYAHGFFAGGILRLERYFGEDFTKEVDAIKAINEFMMSKPGRKLLRKILRTLHRDPELGTLEDLLIFTLGQTIAPVDKIVNVIGMATPKTNGALLGMLTDVLFNTVVSVGNAIYFGKNRTWQELVLQGLAMTLMMAWSNSMIAQVRNMTPTLQTVHRTFTGSLKGGFFGGTEANNALTNWFKLPVQTVFAFWAVLYADGLKRRHNGVQVDFVPEPVQLTKADNLTMFDRGRLLLYRWAGLDNRQIEQSLGIFLSQKAH